jgi:hypothetical protein
MKPSRREFIRSAAALPVLAAARENRVRCRPS